MDVMASGLGPILLINLLITFFPGFNISIGGHVGGLIGGVLAALAIEAFAKRRSPAAAVLVCTVIAVASVVAAIAFTTAKFPA
jgi:membrane associated rhomboid family serine protease